MPHQLRGSQEHAGIPAHIRLHSLDKDALWRHLEFQFSELRDLVEVMRLETVEEAVGAAEPNADPKKPLRWSDTAPRWDGKRAWLLIPYVDGIDQEYVQSLINTARILIPELIQDFRKKIPTSQFLFNWGQFCSAAGALRLLYQSGSTPGYARAEKAKALAVENLDKHRRWFSFYYLRARAISRNRADAVGIVHTLIRHICDGEHPVDPTIDLTWFDTFLNLKDSKRNNPSYSRKDNKHYGNLRRAFRRDLFEEEMRKLVAQGSEGIPPIDWDLPHPPLKRGRRPRSPLSG